MCAFRLLCWLLFSLTAIQMEGKEVLPIEQSPPYLLNKLLYLHKNSLLEQSPLWQVHSTWIQNLFTFVQTYQHTAVVYPTDIKHPIYHFDQKDAEQIIRPILKNIYEFELTNELICHLFFEKILLQKDNKESSSIKKLQKDKFKNETFRVAQITFELIRGNTLFLLGQTPAYLGEMVKAIDREYHGGSQILQIPFSGRPDYTQKLIYKELWPTAFLDIITTEGRRNFLSLIEKQNFSPLQWRANPKKIFILDNSTGTSVSCFLALLKGWFEETAVPFPEIVFLQMCKQDDLCVLTEQQKWKKVEKPNLCFNDKIHFDIPVIFLGMQDAIQVAFDEIYDNLRMVPSFNGLYWSKEYLQSLFTRYPTSEARELMQEYQMYACNRLRQKKHEKRKKRKHHQF